MATWERIAQRAEQQNIILSNEIARLREALAECITSEGAACFGDMDNHPEWMQRRLYAISDIARAAIEKATQ